MTLASIPYDPDHDVRQAARSLARACNAMADRGQVGSLYGHYKAALSLLLDPCHQADPILPEIPARVRY